jgi:dihydroorotase
VSHRGLLLRGGRVIDPASGRDEVADVYITPEGTVGEVGARLAGQVARSVPREDVTGQWVLPGFVDLHVHLREPGHEYKETVETGASAAVAGGFTTVCCMANTTPVNDTGSVTRYIVEQARRADLARVLPVGAVTKGMKGQELAEMADMVEQGAVAFSDDGLAILDAHLMRRALEYTSMLGVPLVVHEEDGCLSRHGRWAMNEGPAATELGLPGLPNAAEDVMVARDLILAELTGGHLHVAHVSTRGAVRMIRDAKARGVRVTAEVAPHHLSLTDEDAGLKAYDTDFKMAPPLRSAADRDALIEGLADGTLDCIATDHAPHSLVEKQVEFELGSCGVVGLETAWGATMKLVRADRLPLIRAVEALTSAPARVFGLPSGTLAAGAPADLVIVDPDARFRVTAGNTFSKCFNSPFAGWTLPTRIARTFVGGRPRFEWDGRKMRVG